MREIQDMTLNVARGLERLERRLSERAQRFSQEFKRLETPKDAFGIRLTAVPVSGQKWFDRVFRQRRIAQELVEPWHRILREKGATRSPPIDNIELPINWRPILRGARAERFPSHFSEIPFNYYRELHCDGLIEFGFASVSSKFDEWGYSLDEPVAMFANLALWADRVRRRAHSPTVEYAIEVEICSFGDAGRVDGNGVVVGGQHAGRVRTRVSHLTPPNVRFPQYALNDSDDIISHS